MVRTTIAQPQLPTSLWMASSAQKIGAATTVSQP